MNKPNHEKKKIKLLEIHAKHPNSVKTVTLFYPSIRQAKIDNPDLEGFNYVRSK